MKTYLECIPCFFKQTIEACKMMGLPEEETKKIIDKVAMHIPAISMNASPPEMGRKIHTIVKEHTNNPDPYKELKKKSNEMALAFYPSLKKLVENAGNRLLKAVEIAIAGNIIDYGAIVNLDVEKELNLILHSEEEKIKNEETKYFAFTEFVASLENTNTLLYLADNAGEIVFDRILMEEIISSFPHIHLYCAVRGKPIINDCIISDAVSAGIDNIAAVISSGSDGPGTILELCSREFLDIWDKSDLIISKGQGNFESLSKASGNIFFMFIAKCRVLARDIGCNLRDVMLRRNILVP